MFTTIDKAIVGGITTIIGVVGDGIAAQCGHAISLPILVGAVALSLVAVYVTPNKAK